MATRVEPASAEALRTLKRYPSDVIGDIVRDDPMYLSSGSGDLDTAYVGHGRMMLDCIRLAMISARKETAQSILDLPSGHGRVLRLLKAEYPEAKLTACDIVTEAVDFCAQTFGATPLYGKPHPRDIELREQYDLIWVGSLLTHLPAEMWPEWLDFFESALTPGGLLALTTGGRSIAKIVADPDAAGNYAGHLHNEDERLRFLRDYEKTDFAFSQYPRWPGYGLSLAKPSWVMSLLEQRELPLVMYGEGRWGLMDLIACVKGQIQFPSAFKFDRPLGD